MLLLIIFNVLWSISLLFFCLRLAHNRERVQSFVTISHHSVYIFIQWGKEKTKGKPAAWIRINTPFIWLINRSDYTNANTELWNNRTNQRDNDCTFLVWPSLVLTPLTTHHPAHSNYGTESLVLLSVQVKLSYPPLTTFYHPPFPVHAVCYLQVWAECTIRGSLANCRTGCHDGPKVPSTHDSCLSVNSEVCISIYMFLLCLVCVV